MSIVIRSLLSLLVAALIAPTVGAQTRFVSSPVVTIPSIEETYTTRCWDEDGSDGYVVDVFDNDRDGYAEEGADPNSRVALEEVFRNKRHCRPGYVIKRGDCDDENPDVHPRRTEVYGNDIDDNCNGRVDEPEFIYDAGGFFNDSDGFSTRIRVNDPEVIEVGNSPSNQLSYRFEYEKLTRTGSPDETETRSVPGFGRSMEGFEVGLRLDDLSASTVYRARIQFFATRYLAEPGGGVRSVDSQIGDPSDWYYTTTGAVRGELKQARTRLLLEGFYEYYRSTYLGEVGYRGSEYIDGLAYDAPEGESWCSEFASYVLDHELGIGSLASVSPMEDYFGDFLTLDPSHDQLQTNARSGDYLALQDKNGKHIHSDLFLAYDRGTEGFWTLDGNSTGNSGLEVDDNSRYGGNEVFIREREFTTTSGGVTFDTVGAWGDLNRVLLD